MTSAPRVGVGSAGVLPDRRQQILDAALACFVDRGYGSTTIDDIRNRSRASIGSIYHHFDGKEGIAAAVYVDRLTAYETGYLAELERASTAREGIESVVSHHLSWAEQEPDAARFLLGHSDLEGILARSGDLPEVNVRFYATVNEWLQVHIVEGTVRRLPADLFYALWLGPSQELTRQWLAGRTRTRPIQATELLAATAWNSISTV